MSTYIYCRDRPQRTIALVADNHILTFENTGDFANKHLPVDGGSRSQSLKCLVQFSRLSSPNVLSEYRQVGRGHGTIGLIALESDIFLGVISASSQAATVRPGETVRRIEHVDFYCVNRSNYDIVYDYANDAQIGLDAEYEPPYQSLKKLLADGSFFYSVDFDLTNRLQDRIHDEGVFDIERLDQMYLWNSFMIDPLLQFRSYMANEDREMLDMSLMLTSVIRGFAQSLTIPASIPILRSARSNMPSTLTLISRVSSLRAGTRFNSRGINDDGNVSNFVETETLLWTPVGVTFSYTQVRGSVPIFWEQTTSNLPTQQKIQVTRSPAATQPAFDKHFDNLQLTYGAVHVVNLLSETKPAEVELSNRYNFHIAHSPLLRTGHNLLQKTNFDFHAETRGGLEAASFIRDDIAATADQFAYFLCEGADNHPHTVLQQEGVFRTNCLDCLDRTNMIQTVISQMALELFFAQQGTRMPNDFWRRHSTLWADNGDILSKSYAGTGALKSSFTRHGKMSWAGALSDATKSAARFMINNFSDKARQRTIDCLLGLLSGQRPVELFDPFNDAVMAEVRRRAAEYSSQEKIRIWVGTYNLNGKSHGARTDLSLWLLSHLADNEEEPGIVAVAFQEI
ncbi:inositol polyphosphate 5-phosphatase, partial [Ascosphaera aggregata]